MNDVTLSTYGPTGRWRFDWLLPALFRPRRLFGRMVEMDTAVSQPPLFILAATALIHALVAGGLKASAAASGGVGQLKRFSTASSPPWSIACVARARTAGLAR